MSRLTPNKCSRRCFFISCWTWCPLFVSYGFIGLIKFVGGFLIGLRARSIIIFFSENGGLTSWSSWGSCSTTCGAGSKARTRSCTNPAPVGAGSQCSGSTTESSSCNLVTCPSQYTMLSFLGIFFITRHLGFSFHLILHLLPLCLLQLTIRYKFIFLIVKAAQ